MADGDPTSATPQVHRRPTVDLSAVDLHDILRLRCEVFVVEQQCAYPDIDGRDLAPGTEQLWMRDERGVMATLRLLDEGDGVWSVGRIVARPDVRSTGTASALVREALAVLDRRGCRSVLIHAQAHLEHWYERFGFATTGPRYVEDGIPHVPMQRAAP